MLRVALIQTTTPADQTAALAHTAPFIEQAAAAGATFIATPEGSNVLQRDRPKFLATARSAEDDPFVVGVRDLARRHAVAILIGSALVRRDDGLYANRSLFIDAQGEIAATYDKIHMFDVDLPTGEQYRESAAYAPGEAARVHDAGFARLGFTICYDVRFPHLHRGLAKAGAQILTVPAAFTRPTGQAHWEVLLRARAIENGAFVLAPAQAGTHEDGRLTWGHSMVVAPWGEIIAEADDHTPGVLLADLDLAAVDKARQAVPSLLNERVFSAPATL
jgi:predicted amidohydrolase